jgi:hypothetical protein
VDPGFMGPKACTIFGPRLGKKYKTTNLKLGVKVNIYLGKKKERNHKKL